MRADTIASLSERVAAAEAAILEARADALALRRCLERLECSNRLLRLSLALAMLTAVGATGVTVFTEGSSPQEVRAPFVVRGAGGEKIVEVLEEKGQSQFLFYSRKELPAAGMFTSDRGGAIMGVLDPLNKEPRALMAIDGLGNGQLGVKDRDGEMIADILRGSSGNQGIGVYAPGGELKALVMGTTAQAGQVNLLGASDQTQAVLVADPRHTQLVLNNPQGVPVATLGGEEAGRLELTDGAGAIVVQAGSLGDGRGIVRAGPEMGGPVPITGLPFAILGKSGQ